MKRNYLKIILPTILTILLFILTIYFIIIPRYEENIMNGKREMIKELTNSAWSILAKYEKDEKEGLISREEAQNTAKSRIQYLRYGEENKDYFWITDMRPFMVMHPFRSDLNGKDLSDFKDPHGKRMFVEFVETVKRSEHGYVDYMWQWKDDSLHIVPKLSFVRIFKPWNWVIGTGVYIEDVEKEITALTRRLLWISAGITVLISLLLIYISNQSLNAERKRALAEKELKESKERYKALVEASTDGLIMLNKGKISFTNNEISRITGYNTTELVNRNFTDIVSRGNNKDILEAFSKSPVKEGQFELSILNRNGETTEVAVTSSVADLYGNQVNILIIKDITIDSGQMSIDYHKLVSTLNLGFFKAKIDNSGKFLFANETAIKIFGFSSFKELAEVNILRFLADSSDLKNLRSSLSTDGFVKNRVIRIHNREKGLTIVSLSLVVLNENINNYIICDGIIEDITSSELEKEKFKSLITHLKTEQFLIERPIGDFLLPAISIDADSTIAQAVETMSKRKTDALLVTRNNNDFIGIVTASDLKNRVVQFDLNPQNPVYLVMTSPVVYSYSGTSVSDAISLCNEKKINHLVVKEGINNKSSIFSLGELKSKLTGSLAFLKDATEKAGSIGEIKENYQKLQTFVMALIANDMPSSLIARITSSFSDSAVRRVVELSISELGEPPVPFSFVCMGSEGRMEESLLTDQDNAIIYSDVPESEKNSVQNYFMGLGESVCNSLHEIGYTFCKGNIMAKNPQWNKPLSDWIRYFANWITTPEPQNLLDAIIFFDFRNVYGDDSFTETIKGNITKLLEKQNVFLYHLAFNTYNTKVQQLSSASPSSDKAGEIIDLKGCLSHIVMFARTYSLLNGIWQTNTIERLTALKTKPGISHSMLDEIIYVYNFLMRLRLKNQVKQIESHFQVNNLLNTKYLSEPEFAHLKKTLSLLPGYQNKISLDFRLKS